MNRHLFFVILKKCIHKEKYLNGYQMLKPEMQLTLILSILPLFLKLRYNVDISGILPLIKNNVFTISNAVVQIFTDSIHDNGL